jgi:hypothetical protein
MTAWALLPLNSIILKGERKGRRESKRERERENDR